MASRSYTDDLPKWIQSPDENLSKYGTITAYTILKCHSQIEDISMLEVREALEKIAMERAISVL